MRLQERGSAHAPVNARRRSAKPRVAARLPRDVLMKMLMADIALLDRMETVCRAGHADPARQLAAAAAIASALAASKEALATALLSLSLDDAQMRSRPVVPSRPSAREAALLHARQR